MLRHCHLVTFLFLSREHLRSRENFAKKKEKFVPIRGKLMFSDIQYLIVLDNTAAARAYSNAWKVDMFARKAAPWNIFSRFFV